MKSYLQRASTFAFSLGLLMCACLPARAAETATDPMTDGKIHVTVTPYIWVPTFNARFRYSLNDIRDHPLSEGIQNTFDAQIGPNKYLSKLNFALMFNGELRKGKYALYTDLINVNAGNQTSAITSLNGPLGNHVFTISGTAASTAVSTIWTIAPAVTVFQKDRTNVNVLVGARLLWIKASTDFHLQGQNDFFPLNGSVQKSDNFGDIIVGTYGAFGLGKNWSIPFYLDAGTGTPNFTLQGILGVKYGNLGVSYRYLDYAADSSSTALVQNVRLNGPQIGYSLHF